MVIPVSRADQVKRGLVRWLHPDDQNPDSDVAKVVRLSTAPPDDNVSLTTFATPPPPVAKVVRLSTAPPTTTSLPWPDKLPKQVARIRDLFPETGSDPAAVSARFGRANQKRQEQIEGIFETLRGLGL